MVSPAAPGPAGPRRWAERDGEAPTRVLVVTGTIPGTRVGAEGLAGLVETLARCPATRVTVVCADGFGALRYAGYFRQQGVEVVAGPQDWPEWCEDRRYHYSHLVVSDEGVTTVLWSLVQATQPQAMAVLYSERLPLRRAQALGEATWHAEGMATVAEVVQGRLLAQLEGVDAAWCASAADAKLVGGLAPAMTVSSFWPALVQPGAPKGFADREGVALVATDSYDMSADPEAAVTRALDELVPAWRRQDMGLSVKIVSDWPTPGLAHLANDVVGAEIVRSGGDLVEALSRVRVVIAPTDHGTGAETFVPAALAAGTPWLCTPKAVEGLGLGELAERAVVRDVASMRHRAWALLNDEATWEDFVAGTAASLAALLERRDAALHSALLHAGIDPPEGALWPLERRPVRPVQPPVQVPLRPPAVADPPAIFVPDSLSEDERYELWHERRGPTPRSSRPSGPRRPRPRYQPTVSVLMPVCDTAAWMLEAAVGSVLDQAYPNWQLCLADDASERPETLAAIDAAGLA